jgi:hypothetical protein
MQGFWRLSNARPVGMNGVMRIPVSEIEAYSRMKRFDFEKTQDFFHYIERMDERYMALVKEAQEKEDQKRNTSSGTPPPRRR